MTLVHQKALPFTLTDRGPWQQTSSGKAFFLADPRSNEVCVYDISQGVSRICRFNGQLKKTVPSYSVGQHEIMISKWMREDGFSPRVQYAALHHDSAEAYYGDLISQVKFLVPEIKEKVTGPVDKAVNEALSIDVTDSEEAEIKHYDLIALATEVKQLINQYNGSLTLGAAHSPREGYQINYWTQSYCAAKFLTLHFQLREEIGLD